MITAHPIMRLVIVGGIITTLTACATQTDLRQNSVGVNINSVNPAGASTLGDQRLKVEGFGEVSVHSSYTSASGRQCRRLVTAQGQSLAINSCRRKGGEWYYTRSLSPVSVSALSNPQQSLIPVESSSGNAIPVRPSEKANTQLPLDTVAIQLDSGETLWAFASRVTGNALNWRKIAEHNGIADARSLAPNQYIEVQTSLVKAGM